MLADHPTAPMNGPKITSLKESTKPQTVTMNGSPKMMTGAIKEKMTDLPEDMMTGRPDTKTPENLAFIRRVTTTGTGNSIKTLEVTSKNVNLQMRGKSSGEVIMKTTTGRILTSFESLLAFLTPRHDREREHRIEGKPYEDDRDKYKRDFKREEDRDYRHHDDKHKNSRTSGCFVLSRL